MHTLSCLLGLSALSELVCKVQSQFVCRQATPTESKKFLSTLLNPGVISPEDGTCFVNNFKVRGSDGVGLTANFFLPAGAGEGPKFPAVVFITSWGSGDFYEHVGTQHNLAKKGYVAMAYTSRGFLFSGGQVQVASPQDIRDVSSALDLLLEQTPTDPARMGVAGLSYGAGIGLLALANEPRIKTAVAMSGWGSLMDQFYANEVPNVTWIGVLLGIGYATAQKRMDPEIIKMARRIIDPDSTPADIAMVKAWADARSPSAPAVVDAINARQAPVMISKNWRDEMFTPNSSMALYERLTCPKKLMLQPGIHISAEQPSAILGAPNKIYDEAFRWFDRWLKDIPNAIDTEPKVMLQPRPNTDYETLSDWPAPELDTARFYLGPRGNLQWSWECWCKRGVVGTLDESGSALKGSDAIDNLHDTSATTGFIPILSALADSFGLPVLNYTFKVWRNHGIRYQSSKVESVLRIRGIPRVNLRVTPEQSRGMLVAYLYSVNHLGFGTLVTHGARAVHWATPNVSMDFSFDLNAVAFDVPDGHRLELVFDTQDNLYGPPVHDGDVFKMNLETGGGDAGAALVLSILPEN